MFIIADSIVPHRVTFHSRLQLPKYLLTVTLQYLTTPVKKGQQKDHYNAFLWPPVSNYFSCFKNPHSVSPQSPVVMYLSICQTVIGILGHISHCVFCLSFLYQHGVASHSQRLPLVSSLDRASVLIWHLSNSSFFFSPHPSSPSVLFSLLSVGAQTDMKKVVGDNATLPCHHQFPSSSSLDIEWLLQRPNSKQKVVR